ncbi:MAG: zinc-ribbon domain-containing protein [Methanobacteriota archaeon]
MVYCQKCGTKNPEKAKDCKKCGARLYPLDKAVEAQAKTCFGQRQERERHEDECFGLPHGGAIFGIIIGAIIIIVGISSLLGRLFNWTVDVWNTIWPALIIIIGVLIVAGAIYVMSKRR